VFIYRRVAVALYYSSLELPYTIKHNGDNTSSKDGNRLKKPLSPPPTVAAVSSVAASSQKRKPTSASKSKPSGSLAVDAVVDFDCCAV